MEYREDLNPINKQHPGIKNPTLASSKHFPQEILLSPGPYQTLSSETKNKILSYTYQGIQDLKKTTKKLLKQAENLIKNIQSTTSFFLTTITNHHNFYTKIQESINDNALLSGYFDIENIENIQYEDLKNTINNYTKTDILQGLTLVNNLEIQIKKCFFIDLIPKNMIQEFYDYDKNLYFVYTGSDELIEFSPSSLMYKKHNVNVLGNGGGGNSICFIPGNKIFTHGGCYNEYSNKTYEIDLITYKCKELPNGIKRCAAQANYYNDRVYIFGGFFYDKNEFFYNLSNCYDIQKNQWVSLSNMPVGIAFTTSVLLDENTFLIAGSSRQPKSFIGTYSINSNSYSLISDKIDSHNISVLVQDGENVYLIGKKIYSAKKTELNKWKKNGKASIVNLVSSSVVIHKRIAYFADTASHIFGFHLDSLQCKLILEAKIY